MANNSKTEGFSDICDLPAELLHEVISHLDNASLVQLGLTCKRLHYISLNTYFDRNDIQNPSHGWLVAYQTPPETLPALRAALWVKEIKQLHFYFNPGVEELVAEVVDMYWLVKRLSGVDLVKLHFSVVDTWIWRYGPSCPVLDSHRWFEVFTKLLEIIIERGCTDLQITGAGMLESMYLQTPEAFAPGPLPQLANGSCSTTQNLTQDQEIAGTGGSVAKPRSPIFISMSSGQDLQAGTSHPTGTSKKKKKGWLLMKLCSPTSLSRLILRKPRTNPGTHMPSQSKQSNRRTTVLVNAEKSASAAPFTRPCKRLTHVSILSEMLFQPTFFHWTLKTLTSNSSSITKLTIKCSNLTTKTWSALLLSLTLPRLEDFEIATDLVVNTTGAAFNDLQDFLSRHPNIHTLHLQGVERLPTPPTIKGPILPNLVCIMAPPGWVSSFLDMQYSYGLLSKLDSIGISTEYYHHGLTFNYDLLDAALLRVAKFPGRRITLTLRFMYESGVSDWFSNHAIFGTENSILSRLYCVSTLVISTAFFVDITKVPESDLLTWFSLFPCVEHIKFVETVEEQRVLLEQPEFLKSVAEKCPKIRSVQIRQVIDLDTFRTM